MIKSVFNKVENIENIMGREENAGYQLFLLIPHCFQEVLLLWIFTVGIVR